MKIRFGFVSNSSSSSFIIAFKGNEDELRKKLRGIFGSPPEKYPIKTMPPIGDVVADNVENDPIKTLNNWDDRYGDWNNPRKNHVRFIERLKEGWTIYYGGFVDARSKLEEFLCDSDIDYEDNEILIWQEGGY